jgi:hypothetical protein
MKQSEAKEESALDYVQTLSQKIGPRPAGSPAEHQAMNFLEEKLTEFGYQLERSPVSFAPEMIYAPFYGLGALCLIAGGFLLPVTPIPALILPIINLCIPQISRWAVHRRTTTATSENLWAALPDLMEKRRLIICAHVDSGKISGLPNPTWIKLFQQFLFFGQRIAIFLSLIAVSHLLGFRLPDELFTAIKGLVLLLGGLWFSLDLVDQFGQSGKYSPGANDNASGVGVALELAKILAVKPPSQFEVAFLFTGAEETGLHGAREFAKRLDAERDVVINLDMVGTGGQLFYVTGDGTISILRTDKRLNQVILKAERNARPAWYTVRSGDFAAFLQQGIRAASLELRAGKDPGSHYHTRYDQFSKIDPESLTYMIRVLKFILAFYEDEFKKTE